MKKLLLLIPLLFVFVPSAFAFDVIEQSGPIWKGGPYYESSTDKVRVPADPYYKVRFVSYGGESWSNVITDKSWTPNDYNWLYFYDAYFVCNRNYELYAYDGSGSTVGYIKIKVNDVVNEPSTCSSGAEGLISASSVSDGGANACDESYICDCILKLRDTNLEIRDSSLSNGQKLDTVTSGINKGNSILAEISRELSSNVNIANPVTPVVPVIDDNGGLEGNKPLENIPFQDDTTYFKDQGDADTGTPLMPLVPNIEDWDGVTRQKEGNAERELNSDFELTKENEKIKDHEKIKENELNQDNEMTKDNFSLDIFQQDSILNKTEEFTKDDLHDKNSFNLAPELDFTNEFEQTNFYNVSE